MICFPLIFVFSIFSMFPLLRLLHYFFPSSTVLSAPPYDMCSFIFFCYKLSGMHVRPSPPIIVCTPSQYSIGSLQRLPRSNSFAPTFLIFFHFPSFSHTLTPNSRAHYLSFACIHTAFLRFFGGYLLQRAFHFLSCLHTCTTFCSRTPTGCIGIPRTYHIASPEPFFGVRSLKHRRASILRSGLRLTRPFKQSVCSPRARTLDRPRARTPE